MLAHWRAQEQPQPTGWDFSALGDRMQEDPVPWDLDAIYRDALAGARSALDMGTGGGEYLRRFAGVLPPDTVATEGWAPNISVAREALAPLDIPVVEFSASDEAPDAVPMPFPDARFDVVLNRHESYSPTEVARILARGGRFITQQVGSGELAGLHRLLGFEPTDLRVTLERFAGEAEAAGLLVEDSDALHGWYHFSDIPALIAYLSRVPWEVPHDFSVDRYADALLTLHERSGGGPIRLEMRRFWLRARKP